MNQNTIQAEKEYSGTKHRLYGSHLGYGYYEEQGGNFIERLAEAMREETWALKIVSIAWTAGPVSMITLFMSFWIANRKIPPTNLIIFIAAFTVITGIISIIVSIVKRATGDRRQAEAERVLGEVLGKLPDLIITIRNESFLQVSNEERKIKGAITLLQDPDATESSIQTALEDLTGNEEIGKAFRRLESFRKKGLFSRIDEESGKIVEKYKSALESVRKKSTFASLLLDARLVGTAPSKRFGQRRSTGILNRMITIVESGKPEDIKLEDAMELVKLIVEFLVDRRFTVLSWHLEGKSPVIKAWKRLEALRVESLRLHRDRRIAEYEILFKLDENKADIGSDAENDSSVIMTDFPNYTFLEDEIGKKRFRKLGLKKRIRNLENIKSNIQKLEPKIKDAIGEFNNLRKEHPDPFEFSVEEESGGDIKLKIAKEKLGLSNKDKIEFTGKLNFYLSTLTTNRQRTRILTSGTESQEEPRPITNQELFAIIVRIFALLESYVDLSAEGVLDSLEASPGINIGPIDYALSKNTKVGWLHAMVDELLDLPAPIALRAAEKIVQEFKQPLSKQFTAGLSKVYDIPIESVDYLSKAS